MGSPLAGVLSIHVPQSLDHTGEDFVGQLCFDIREGPRSVRCRAGSAPCRIALKPARRGRLHWPRSYPDASPAPFWALTNSSSVSAGKAHQHALSLALAEFGENIGIADQFDRLHILAFFTLYGMNCLGR